MDYGLWGEHQDGNTTEHSFTGKKRDSGTGLSYFGARYYDPNIGRFISMDPIKDGRNWYIYCNNNPLKNIDPNGLSPFGIFQTNSPLWKTSEFNKPGTLLWRAGKDDDTAKQIIKEDAADSITKTGEVTSQVGDLLGKTPHPGLRAVGTGLEVAGDGLELTGKGLKAVVTKDSKDAKEFSKTIAGKGAKWASEVISAASLKQAITNIFGKTIGPIADYIIDIFGDVIGGFAEEITEDIQDED